MRSARAHDYRRKAYSRPYGVCLRSIEFDCVPSIGSGALTLPAGPHLICGGNGVGKSSLLHGIYLALVGDADELPSGSLRRLEGGHFRCRIDTLDGERLYGASIVDGHVNPEQAPGDLSVQFLDAGPRSYRWLEQLGTTANLDELLEGHEPSVSSANEVAELGYLIGKTYEEHSVFEIDELSGLLLYPRVRHNGVEYSFEDMGLGELALNILYWQLRRAPKRSILLFEEPETFISPRSQRHLINLIFKYAVERELSVLITTHSLGIAGAFDSEHITFAHGAADAMGLIQPARPHQLNALLGVRQHQKAIIVYEDEAALFFGCSLLDRLDPDLGYLVEQQIAGDKAAITKMASNFPVNSIVHLVGVYDADVDLEEEGTVDRCTKLPGHAAPEAEVRPLVQEYLDETASAVERRPSDLRAADAALEEAWTTMIGYGSSPTTSE